MLHMQLAVSVVLVLAMTSAVDANAQSNVVDIFQQLKDARKKNKDARQQSIDQAASAPVATPPADAPCQDFGCTMQRREQRMQEEARNQRTMPATAHETAAAAELPYAVIGAKDGRFTPYRMPRTAQVGEQYTLHLMVERLGRPYPYPFTYYRVPCTVVSKSEVVALPFPFNQNKVRDTLAALAGSGVSIDRVHRCDLPLGGDGTAGGPANFARDEWKAYPFMSRDDVLTDSKVVWAASEASTGSRVFDYFSTFSNRGVVFVSFSSDPQFSARASPRPPASTQPPLNTPRPDTWPAAVEGKPQNK